MKKVINISVSTVENGFLVNEIESSFSLCRQWAFESSGKLAEFVKDWADGKYNDDKKEENE